MHEARPPLILVVGQDYSATNLICSLLAEVGVTMPSRLAGSAPRQRKGNVERDDISGIQEQLLIDLDRCWPGPMGMIPLPVNWLTRQETHLALGRMRAVLEEVSAPAQGPWGIRDSRSALLLPLWRRICDELNIPLRLLLTLGEPSQVIDSLGGRDAGEADMMKERAEQLWWHYNQTVLKHSNGVPLLVVDDRRWFQADPNPDKQLLQLMHFCGLEPTAEDQAKLEHCLRRIRPEYHQYSVTQTDEPRYTRSIALYESLCRGDLESARCMRLSDCEEDHDQATQSSSEEKHDQAAHSDKRKLRQILFFRYGTNRKEEANTEAKADREAEANTEAIACNGWFDEDFYKRCNPHLANYPDLLEHYLKHGWQEGRQPHPLFDPSHYFKTCHARGVPAPADRAPLLHFLRLGIVLGLSPSPLLESAWRSLGGLSLQPDSAPSLREVHPWAGAALAIADQDHAAAATLLGHWLQEGIPETDWQTLSKGSGTGLQWPHNPPREGLPRGIGRLSLWSSGLELNQLCSQGWLASLNELERDDTAADLTGLHLLLLPPGQQPEPEVVLSLCQDPRVVLVDPDPVRCRCWERLRLPHIQLPIPSVRSLNAFLSAKPWLERASQELGLPDPKVCPAGTLLCLGSGTPEWNRINKPGIWHIPGYDELDLADAESSRTLAAWLWHAHQHGLRLIRLHPEAPMANEAWAEWLPMQWFQPFGLTPEALHSELRWRDADRPIQPAIQTPSPATVTAWVHECSSDPPEAAVVISLYNYAERITHALSSVERQTVSKLELIIVDDASSDESASVVKAWLQAYGKRFHRALLLQHCKNGGLAAARNTALQHSKADWCFVLDADNQIDCEAVEQCLKLARGGSESLAVVHPLIRKSVENAAGESRLEDLLSRHSWQARRFGKEGNHVDAMALIRRSAWETVGGYHHIPGGWEDFDFWCCLIDAGYHGVLCPNPLATYSVHEDSMLQSQSNRDLRRLSRVLEERHPWLHLPLNHEDA